MVSGTRPSKTIVNAIDGTVDRIMCWGELRLNVGYRTRRGYTALSVYGRQWLRHRFIYMHFHGPIAPWMDIDHIHGIEAGDGIANLRWTTHAGNCQNMRKANINNKSSGLLGVTWHAQTKKWRAVINTEGKRLSLGLFNTAEEAHQAYVIKKREIHPTCTI